MNDKLATELRNVLAGVALNIATTSADSAPSLYVPVAPFSNMHQEDWSNATKLWRAHAGKLLGDVSDRVCPACGTQKSRKLFDSYDNHPFHECDDCRCWFVPKNIDGHLFERFFAKCPDARKLSDAMTESRSKPELEIMDIERIGNYLDEIIPLLPGKPRDSLRYLDVGCGVGHSLRAAHARGLSSFGIEADPKAVETARRNDLPVRIIDAPLPPGPFDILSFWETLEHIHDPLGALARSVRLLADDGLVAITVPNLNASAIRVLREDCSYVFGGYNTPGHINLFHLPAIHRLLDRVDLHILDADGQYSSNPIELVTHFFGGNRGAWDILENHAPKFQLQQDTEQFINNIWPSIVLLERLTLTSPILKIIACKKGYEHVFADAISDNRKQRLGQIAKSARELSSG